MSAMSRNSAGPKPRVVPAGDALLRIEIGVRDAASSQLLAERQVLRWMP